MVDRELIVNEARSWIGTRFHHQGRLKKSEKDKGGVDCVGLVLGVADAVGVTYNGIKLSSFDRSDYAKMPDGNMLKNAFAAYLKEIDREDAQAGDILMFKFDKDPQHVGIVSGKKNNLNIIHCYMQARCVVEHSLDMHWKSRVVAAFRFFD